MFHLLNDLSKRGPRGTGCGHDQTRESLNEVQIHVSPLNALGGQFLVRVIPKDDLSLYVLVCLSGRSFWLLMIYLSNFCQMKVGRCEVHEIPKDGQSLIVLDGLSDALSGRSFLLRGQMSFCLSKVCQKKVCRCEVHEIPKDGRSSNVLDDLSGRSFLLRGQMSFALRKVCQKMVGQFLECVIPKDGRNEKLAYARFVNRNHVILNYGRYKKVCLTSSFFPGGRRLVLRCVVYQSTRALERGHLI
jgi:imidazoleglycerol phosphate dehydratase HisB